MPGVDATVGSDPARALVVLGAAGVEPIHATFALRGAELLVRDEASAEGTFVDGVRATAGSWARVAHGARVRLGRAELVARLE